MKLYTITIDMRPILVISTDAQSAVPEELAKDLAFLKAHRKNQAFLASFDDEIHRMSQLKEIDDALDTWLGADLKTLTINGQLVWDGNSARVRVREATTDEQARWHITRQQALDTGEQDAGDEDWLTYLVGVTDPTDPVES